mmetsp:Transcript_24268/g.44552  ORF Transcript_24268/g.44552 Transcript_24268/m.44552 type:complete len:838 (+) Transcript_24268:86-2599(+)
MSSTAVHATVTGARNLPKADWFGHSDLYVLCQVQPRPEVHGQTKVARTALENNLLNPVWNETLHLQPYNQGETLEFKVMDRETLRSIELGRAVLQWPDNTRRGFRGALPIQMASAPSNQAASPMLDVAVSVDVPEVQPVQNPDVSQTTQLPPTAQQPPPPTSSPTAPASPQDSRQSMTPVTQQQTQPVQYPPQQYTQIQQPLPTQPQQISVAPSGPMRVKLAMISGRNFPVPSYMSTKDAYCICQIPGRPHTDVQTPVCKNSVNPLWNSEHEIHDFYPGDMLEFVAFNKQTWPMNDERLGVARLQLNPETGHDGFIPLTDETNTKANAAINVRAAVIGAGAGAPSSYGQGATVAGAAGSSSRVGVNIVSGRNLRVDPNRSEVFCTTKVLGKPESEVRSIAVQGTSQPVWNLNQEVPNYAAGDTLEIAVYDQAGGVPRSVGGATLPGSYILPSGWNGDLPIYELTPDDSNAPPINVGVLQARIGPIEQPTTAAQQQQVSQVQTTYVVQSQSASAQPTAQAAPPPTPPPTAGVVQSGQSFQQSQQTGYTTVVQQPPSPPPQQQTSLSPAQSYPAPVQPMPPPYCGGCPPYSQRYGPPGYAVQPYTTIMPPAAYQGMPPAYPMQPGGCMYGPCTVQMPPTGASMYPMPPGGIVVQQCPPGYAAGIESPLRRPGSEVSSRLQRNLAYNQNAYRTEMEQRREIKDAFDTFDTSRSGYVDYYSLKCSMRALGFPVRKADVLEAMREEGCIETGRISFDEFSRILMRKYGEREPLDDILRVFRYFDKEGKGRISLADLRKVVAELGEGLSESDLQCMIEEFDENRDGCINESEFVKVMQSAAMH